MNIKTKKKKRKKNIGKFTEDQQLQKSSRNKSKKRTISGLGGRQSRNSQQKQNQATKTIQPDENHSSGLMSPIRKNLRKSEKMLKTNLGIPKVQ